MTWLAYSHLGVPKRVTLTQQPGGAKVNVPFTTQPIAKLVDGSGVLARVQDVNIVASKVAGTGTLSGTTTIPTVEGISAFTNLQMDTVTATVTLGFASSGLTSVNATPFNVTTTQFTLGAAGTSYAISGTAAALTYYTPYKVMTASPASYAWTGSDATLTYSGGGSSGWLANLPGSYTTVITDYAFNTTIPAANTTALADGSGWTINFNTAGHTTRVADATGGISPGYAMQNEYYNGAPSGSGVGDLFKNISTSISEIYACMRIWHDASFEQHPISTKLLYWEDGNLIVLFNSDANFLSYYNGGTTYTANVDTSATMATFRGKWVTVEIQIKRGSSGFVKIWLNNSLVNNRSLSIPTISGLSEIKIASTWGGSGGSKTGNSYRRIDHIYIAGP